MALAAVKAINARIRSNQALDYFCSIHFWGRASNFTIPLAAIADTRKSPELISPTMTGALIIYSFTSMKYSISIVPKGYLFLAFHPINACAQLTQGYRYLDYYYWGGKESGKYAEAAAAGKAAVEAAKAAEK
ncbi:hypothetical protein VTJ49DRAFT_6015 [Mycothermus thermophilus]|uniref:Mitochondrial pyruvate carrier n=1 Tax=Humicola insolens TaxID=85995 RepID=A0ABR3VK58_HUMIN